MNSAINFVVGGPPASCVLVVVYDAVNALTSSNSLPGSAICGLHHASIINWQAVVLWCGFSSR
jgi:hypothetical protein